MPQKSDDLIRITGLDPKEIQQGLAKYSGLLAQAFIHDPWINLLMGQNTLEHQKFFSFVLQLAYLTHQHVVVAQNPSHEVMGLAIVQFDKRSTTHGRPQPISPRRTGSKTIKLLKATLTFLRWMGLKRFALLNQYMAITAKERKAHGPLCHYLVCIGVLPSMKGKGVGKALLEYIHDQIGPDPIALDTEAQANVPLYQRFGYEVTTSTPLGGITLYTMLRTK